MRFPPVTFREWIEWFIYPRFPRRVLSVYDRTGVVDSACFDEEIETVVRTKNLTVIRCVRHGEDEQEWRTWATLGGDPFQYSELYTPSELFGVYTSRWSMWMGLVVYTLFLLSLFLGFTEQIWWLVLVLLIYIAGNVQRFGTPSIRCLSLHVVGSIGGLPFTVPGPVPQSVLSLSQLLQILHQPEMVVNDDTVRELVKEIESLKEVNKRLYGLIIRIERESDKLYDVAHKIGEELSHSIIEEVRESYEKLLTRRTKMMLIIAFAMLLLGLILGFLAGTTTAVEVVPP
ncbi:MAG: hypothetical protein QXM08_00430 [Thermofilaceae archaeon]